MIEPVASVVVPVYNRLDLARPVLDAFASQRTTHPFEVLVVDDGSDPPASTAMAGRDSRFRLLVQPNRGRSAAINTGLTAARGEIMIVCDADIVPTTGFVEEHLAFHRDHPAVEDTHLGEVTWGVAPPAVAALLGPRANPRMLGLTGPVPWTLWYTDNWSLKRQLVDSGVVRFDEAFRTCYWEDLELAHRLANRGIRNQATGSAEGRHLQCRSLDERLDVFSKSVPNLLHLAGRVEHDASVLSWLAHRSATPRLVAAGEGILRRSIAHIEAVAGRLPELDQGLVRILGTSLSAAVFRCGMQRGFVEMQAASNAPPAGDVVKATMLPNADLVRSTIAVLITTGQTDAARMLLDFSSRRVAEACGDRELVIQFIGRATSSRWPPPAHPRRP